VDSGEYRLKAVVQGSDTLEVVGVNMCDTSEFLQQSIIVFDGAPGAPDFIIGETKVCVGQLVEFSAVGADNASSYQWVIQPTIGWHILGELNDSSISVVVDTPGTYTVRVQSRNPCDAANQFVSLMIQAIDTPMVEVEMIGNTLYAPPGFDSYMWFSCTNKDGTDTTHLGVTTPTLAIESDGYYGVEVTVGSGCAVKSSCVF
jgi:hypothetical protein